MKVIITENYEEMSKKAAEIMIELVKNNPNAILGLATGSSPIGMYKAMIEDCANGGASYKNVSTVNLDEYAGLTADHDQSYAYFMRTNLFDHIDIDQKNTNLPCGSAKDAQAECDRYNALLENMKQDVQVLGLGSNGHIGFNEPADAFSYGTHVVELAQSTIEANSRFFATADDVPKYAFTMGIGAIMKAKRVLLVCNGAGKAQAVKDCFFGPIKPQAPGSILQLHPDFTLVADEAALELVKDLI